MLVSPVSRICNELRKWLQLFVLVALEWMLIVSETQGGIDSAVLADAYEAGFAEGKETDLARNINGETMVVLSFLVGLQI